MKREQHDLQQGSEMWHQFRATHYGASEAAAMLGISPYQTRQELLRQKATGASGEITPALQAVFDRGHETEVGGREMAEQIIGEELFPVVMSFGKLSASCDGLTICGETAFEHKQWSEELAASLRDGVLPEHHQPQCQQVLHVTGAERLLFMCSDGTAAKCVHVWVEPNQKWLARVQKGWEQFDEDLRNYQHVERPVAAVAAPIRDLPALSVEISGRVVASNLADWKAVVTERISAINTDLQTDQDFADADSMVKFLADGEKRIDAVKATAQAQAATIDELFRALDDVKASMRAKRLELNNLVASRKDAIRAEIRDEGVKALREHLAKINGRVGANVVTVDADFGAAMKSKRTIDSLRDAVSTLLAQKKIEANEIADRAELNLRAYRQVAAGHEALFPDLHGMVTKDADAFLAIVENRIAKHKAEEAARLEAERARIRTEEEARARRLAEEPLRAQQAQQSNVVASQQAGPPVSSGQSNKIVAGPLTSGAGRLRDLIDDELLRMGADKLQRALDALRAINAEVPVSA